MIEMPNLDYQFVNQWQNKPKDTFIWLIQNTKTGRKNLLWYKRKGDERIPFHGGQRLDEEDLNNLKFLCFRVRPYRGLEDIPEDFSMTVDF